MTLSIDKDHAEILEKLQNEWKSKDDLIVSEHFDYGIDIYSFAQLFDAGMLTANKAAHSKTYACPRITVVGINALNTYRSEHKHWLFKLHQYKYFERLMKFTQWMGWVIAAIFAIDKYFQ